METTQAFASKCKQIVSRCKEQKEAYVFEFPVNTMLYSDYLGIVSKPMDFASIEIKLGNNEYSSAKDFVEDMRLVFSNAILYNEKKPNTRFVVSTAKRVRKIFEKHAKDLLKITEVKEVEQAEEEEEEEIIICSGVYDPTNGAANVVIVPNESEKEVEDMLAPFVDETIVANVSSRTRSSAMKLELKLTIDEMEDEAGNDSIRDGSKSVTNADDDDEEEEEDDNEIVCPSLTPACRAELLRFFAEDNLDLFSFFVDEVDPAVHADYRLIVADPISISTIAAKLEVGDIDTFAELAALVRRVTANAFRFNHHRDGKRLRQVSISLLERFEAAAKKAIVDSSVKKKKRSKKKKGTDAEREFLMPPATRSCINVIESLLSEFDPVTKDAYMVNFMAPLRYYFQGSLPANYCSIVYGANDADANIDPPCVGSALSKLLERGIDGTCQKNSWKSDVDVFEREVQETFENCIKYWTAVDMNPKLVEEAKYMLQCFNAAFSEKTFKSLGVSVAQQKINASMPVVKIKKPSLPSFPRPHKTHRKRKSKAVDEDYGVDFEGSDVASSIHSRIETKLDMKEELLAIMAELEQHKIRDVWTCRPFIGAVNSLEYPDYYTIVTNAMDLAVINKKIKSGNYEIDSLVSDMLLIRDNAYLYNKDDDDGREVRLLATAMLNYARFLLKPVVNRARTAFISLAVKTDQFMDTEPANWSEVLEFADMRVRKVDSRAAFNGLLAWNIHGDDEDVSEMSNRMDQKSAADDDDESALFRIDDDEAADVAASAEEIVPQYGQYAVLESSSSSSSSRKKPRKGEKPGFDIYTVSSGVGRIEVPEWENRAHDIVIKLRKHKYIDTKAAIVNWYDSAIDLNPNEEARTAYLKLVTRPMELRTLIMELCDGRLSSFSEFFDKSTLIFRNAIVYNETRDDENARRVLRHAQHLFEYCKWLGLEYFDESKEDASVGLTVVARDECRKLRMEMINDVEISSPDHACSGLISRFTAKGDASLKPFMYPVDVRNLPNYVLFVLSPMDFQTLKGKVLTEKHYTYSSFLEDVELISDNAIAYNAKFTTDAVSISILDMAHKLKEKVAAYIHNNFSIDAADIVCLKSIENIQIKRLSKEEIVRQKLVDKQMMHDAYTTLTASQKNIAKRNEITLSAVVERATGDTFNQFKAEPDDDSEENFIVDAFHDEDDEEYKEAGKSRRKKGRSHRNKVSFDGDGSSSSSKPSEKSRFKLSLGKFGDDLRTDRIRCARSNVLFRSGELMLFNQAGHVDLNAVNSHSILFGVANLTMRPAAMVVETEEDDAATTARSVIKTKRKLWGEISDDEDDEDESEDDGIEEVSDWIYPSEAKCEALEGSRSVAQEKVGHNPTCVMVYQRRRWLKHAFQCVRCESDARSCLQAARELRQNGVATISFIIFPLSWKAFSVSRSEAAESVKIGIRALAKHKCAKVGRLSFVLTNVVKDVSKSLVDVKKLQSVSLLTQIVCHQRICTADDVLSLSSLFDAQPSTERKYNCLSTTILLPQRLFDLSSSADSSEELPVFNVDDAVLFQMPLSSRSLHRENSASSPSMHRKYSDVSDGVGAHASNLCTDEADAFTLACTQIGNFVIRKRTTGSHTQSLLKPSDLTRHSSGGRARSDSIGSSTVFGEKIEIPGAEFTKWKQSPLSLYANPIGTNVGCLDPFEIDRLANTRHYKHSFKRMGFEQLFGDSGNVFIRKMSKQLEIAGMVQRMMIASPKVAIASQYVSIEIIELLASDCRADDISLEHAKQSGCICAMSRSERGCPSMTLSFPLPCCEITLEVSDSEFGIGKFGLPLPSNLFVSARPL